MLHFYNLWHLCRVRQKPRKFVEFHTTKASISYVSVHALRVSNLWNMYWILNTLLLLKSRQPLHDFLESASACYARQCGMNSMRTVYLFHMQGQLYAVTIARMFHFSFMLRHGKESFHAITMPRKFEPRGKCLLTFDSCGRHGYSGFMSAFFAMTTIFPVFRTSVLCCQALLIPSMSHRCGELDSIS